MRIRDSRGRPSTTLTLVVIAFVAATGKFILGGFGWVPDMTGTDYAAVLGALLGGWVWREHDEKRGRDGGDSTDQ